jgi:phage terminase large subunit-like protein
MPGVQAVKVGYERFGMDSDLEFFELEMERTKDAFEIVELAYPREGPASKYDRIQRLEPLFRGGKFWLAQAVDGKTKRQQEVVAAGQHFRVFEPLKHRDENGELYSLNKRFLEEYLNYPFSVHDDFLDISARIFDMEPVAPVIIAKETLEPQVFADGI